MPGEGVPWTTEIGSQNLPFPERKKATDLDWSKLLFDDEREALPTDAFEPVRYTEWAPCNYWRYRRGRNNKYKSIPQITATIPTAARNKKRAGDDSNMIYSRNLFTFIGL